MKKVKSILKKFHKWCEKRKNVVGLILGCISGFLAITLMSLVANEISCSILKIFPKWNRDWVNLITKIVVCIITFILIWIITSTFINKTSKKIEIASKVFSKRKLQWAAFLLILITFVYIFIYFKINQDDLKTILNFLWAIILVPTLKYIIDIPNLKIYIRDTKFEESPFDINKKINIFGKNDGRSPILIRFMGFCLKKDYCELKDEDKILDKLEDLLFIPENDNNKNLINPKVINLPARTTERLFYNINPEDIIYTLKKKNKRWAAPQVQLYAVFKDENENIYAKDFEINNIAEQLLFVKKFSNN